MLVLLVGPKGSGKSHIGRLMEAHFGIHFFHVEPLRMAYYAECRAEGRAPVIAEGVERVHPHIAHALGDRGHVSVETTGASPEILAGLLALRPAPTRRRAASSGTLASPRRPLPAADEAPPVPDRLVVRVKAPLDVCLERVAGRDPSHQIPVDLETVRKVHALSESLPLDADLVIENVSLSDADLVGLLARVLRDR